MSMPYCRNNTTSQTVGRSLHSCPIMKGRFGANLFATRITAENGVSPFPNYRGKARKTVFLTFYIQVRTLKMFSNRTNSLIVRFFS